MILFDALDEGPDAAAIANEAERFLDAQKPDDRGRRYDHALALSDADYWSRNRELGWKFHNHMTRFRRELQERHARERAATARAEQERELAADRAREAADKAAVKAEEDRRWAAKMRAMEKQLVR